MVARQFREPVQPFGEGARVARAVAALALGRAPAAAAGSAVVRGADGGDQVSEVPHEASSFAPSVRPPVAFRRPEGRGAHPQYGGRELDPAAALLVGAAAERVDVELVLREPAYEPVAPEPGLTRRVRVATVRE